MNPGEAEKIINDYGRTIASIKKGDHVQDVFALPYSPGKIRYAFFVYTEALIEQGLFTDEIKNNLSTTYAMLNTRFVENPDEINEAMKSYGKDEKAREIINKYGGLTAFMPSIEKMTEYHNFVADYHGNWGK
jgi:uncharacterized UPF0160 family protein